MTAKEYRIKAMKEKEEWRKSLENLSPEEKAQMEKDLEEDKLIFYNGLFFAGWEK